MTHSRAHQTLTFSLQLTKLPYLPDTHIDVADDIRCFGVGIREAGLLNISGSLHAFANHFTFIFHRLAHYFEDACSEKVLFPDFNQNVLLPEGEQVTLEFTPEKTGQYGLQCQMGMLRGKLIME